MNIYPRCLVVAVGVCVLLGAVFHISMARTYSKTIDRSKRVIAQSPSVEDVASASSHYIQMCEGSPGVREFSTAEALYKLSGELKKLDATGCSINTMPSYVSGAYHVTTIKLRFTSKMDTVHELMQRISAPEYHPSRVDSLQLARTMNGGGVDAAVQMSLYERRDR